MARWVPGRTSSPALPDMIVIRPSGLRDTRWSPVVRTCRQPCSWSNLITSRTLGGTQLATPSKISRPALELARTCSLRQTFGGVQCAGTHNSSGDWQEPAVTATTGPRSDSLDVPVRCAVERRMGRNLASVMKQIEHLRAEMFYTVLDAEARAACPLLSDSWTRAAVSCFCVIYNDDTLPDDRCQEQFLKRMIFLLPALAIPRLCPPSADRGRLNRLPFRRELPGAQGRQRRRSRHCTLQHELTGSLAAPTRLGCEILRRKVARCETAQLPTPDNPIQFLLRPPRRHRQAYISRGYMWNHYCPAKISVLLTTWAESVS
jgi:hypothetical protein